MVEAPPLPDWRLFAAYHAIVVAEDVRDVDTGLEHALRVAARELDYVLHRRPKTNGTAPATTPTTPRPTIGQVEAPARLPHIRDDGIREVIKVAVAQGFTWKMQGSGHLRATGPDGRGFTVSTTAVGSNARALKNVRAEARRAGVAL